MTYFAVHVKTGWEQTTVDQLQKQIKNSLFDGIASIIAPVVQIKKFIGEESVIIKRKLLASSYIYIKIVEEAFEIPAKIYHFIKSIGGVLKILPYNVPKEEIESFCFNYNLALEEAEIEVQLDEVAKSVETLHNEKQQILHEANIVQVGHEQDDTVIKGMTLERTVDKVNRLINKGKEINHRLLKKCRAYVHQKHETFRFPLSLFLATRDRVDPKHLMSNKQLTSASFILPELIKTLEMELAKWKS